MGQKKTGLPTLPYRLQSNQESYWALDFCYNIRMKTIVTTSLGQDSGLVKRAQALAQQYSLIYLNRNKQSLKKLTQGEASVLVVYQDKLAVVHPDGSQLAFHPDTAMLRIKAPHDPLLDLLGPRPLKILDATMGLASDSIVMAWAGYQVTALESNPLIHLVVSQGLANFQTGNARLDRAMRTISPLNQEALAYLREQQDKSYDVIYFDPMFTQIIKESENLAGLKPLANYSPLSRELLAEASRVAQKVLIIKAHFCDCVFEEFGFDRQVRPNQKFHYGIKRLTRG